MATADDADDSPEAVYWGLAEPFLHEAGMDRSTMMGMPCLRFESGFVGGVEASTGRLVVKLPAATVSRLVAENEGESFAPAGRVFREWLAVPFQRRAIWGSVLAEAVAFARERPAKARKR